MAGVKASIDLQLSARLTGSPDLGSSAYSANIHQALQFTPGTASIGEADLLFTDTRTLAASATENLDLAGVLMSPLNVTITNAEVMAIYIKAAAGNTNDVLFFGAASNPFNGPLTGTTPKLALRPGQWTVLGAQNGWTVTAGTGDILLVGNGGAGSSVTYDIVIIGRSVAA